MCEFMGKLAYGFLILVICGSSLNNGMCLMVSSGGKLAQSQPTSQSSGLGLFNTSSRSAPNDDVCIVNGQPVSGDFKRFLENHPDMDFYEARRKFKEEQKAKQNLRQGPKLH